MYSFTKHREKKFFQEDSKLWLLFLTAITFLFLIFSLFIFIEAYNYKKDINYYKTNIVKLKKETESLENKTAFILKQKEIYAQINLSNSMLKDSIKNLLDLIPDPITLTKIVIDKNRLEIYGITPTKDVYNVLLLPPLKSIFTTTKTNFYLMNNGWYRFQCLSELKDED